MHDAGTGLDDGNLRLAHHGVDQVGAAARNQHVDVAARLHELLRAVAAELVDGLHGLRRAARRAEIASWMSPTSTRLVFSAALPPRSTTALPLFSASAAMSMVTFGRAS